MPRTKQVHPRNLRDKIEEAQKELNGAEVSKKEILEAGVKGAPESLKGVKRKKIVAENHLKKIPKSPLRNPLQAKPRQSAEEAPRLAALPGAPAARGQRAVPRNNGKQIAKQNGESPRMTTEVSKPEDPASPKKPSFPPHPAELRRWRSEGADPTRLGTFGDTRDSRSWDSKSRPHDSECTPRCPSTSPPYTNTAFDVLLKAMEPELSSLSQKGSSCAIQTERLRPRPTAPSPARLKSNSLDPPSPNSPESLAEPQCSPSTSLPVRVAAAQQSEQAAGQSVSCPYNPLDHLISQPGPPHQQLPGTASFAGSLAKLQMPETPRLEQMYATAVVSATGLSSPSSRTQVAPPSQQVDSASPLSISPASSAQSPPGALYNSHVASVVSQSVEQMCNLLLRDQKPKKQGKYICEYCNRACAKPSVLLKHIRSHTGERPYPCVTCGFSFKTKSNLYKHKKSHAHTIKLGLVLQPDAGGVFLSQESPKALSIHSDVEDSGESDEEGPGDGRQADLAAMGLQPVQIMQIASVEALPKSGPIPSNPEVGADSCSLQDRASESQALTELPKVVVHPVSVCPLRTDSPTLVPPKPELPSTQRQNLQLASLGSATSLEIDEKSHQKGDTSQPDGKQDSHGGPTHAQLQRQQATEDPQEQQGKLLSPRSLGSTDSGYFSRSESADQALSPPTPFARTFPTTDSDPAKNIGPSAPRVSAPAPFALPTGEKPSLSPGQMRPPLATKTLEERISKLISDNEALVDDKQLDSVKPRRTSLSRRGSIDSPKSYIFKDSFQFDLKPVGRRPSSSSDIPKSPFTPTEKSKQVFLLSVPSLDCLPITRSNSMPTTGYSAVPASVIPPPHPLRGSQSFDDKIGTFYDDVFVPGPNASMPPSGHPRPLVRQAAVEDSSAGDSHALGTGQSTDEGCQGCPATSEPGPARSKTTQASHLEKKKPHQGRGTMFECETCRNRYRKLENFENHKKFYCSELHGPKTKAAVREPERGCAPSTAQPQVLHHRVAGPAGVWEQTPQIRKRRKMKSVGDDEDVQPLESGSTPRSVEVLQLQPTTGSAPSPPKHTTTPRGDQPPRSIQLQSTQVQLVARGPEQALDPKPYPVVEPQPGPAAQDKMEVKRQGSGISVIQHTNALSRPSSLDKLQPLEGGIPASCQELSRMGQPGALRVIGLSLDEGRSPGDPTHPRLSTLPADPHRGELRESSRKMAGERLTLGQPLRLVRQHNIQVPEILVTEEPDRDLEAQGHDGDKSERFSWPQRSETLSKLPTEKLPPKKKRLRLADVERSSTDSSFESTLSRSLSQESSLSRASSLSASFDIEDGSRSEASPKVDVPGRAAEFLLIPPGANMLSVPGGHREMRRAASEQMAPTLMEVSDFRSKSFDCGSMTLPQAVRVDSQPSTSSSGAGASGHVPLLERRRGPLIRQISLNIAPDGYLSPVNPLSFQAVTLPSVDAVPSQGSRLPDTASADFAAHSVASETPAKGPHTGKSSSTSTHLFPPQQLFGINLLNQTLAPLNLQNTTLPLPVSAQGPKADALPTVRVSSASEDCFAPKYQLQCQALASGQAGSSPLHPLPSQAPEPSEADRCVALVTLPAKQVDASSSTCALPVLGLRPPGDQVPAGPPCFVLPVHLQSHVPSYCFATVTSLPQILVTQDLSSTPICQNNQNVVPIGEEQNSRPTLQIDCQNVLLVPEKEPAGSDVPSDGGQSCSVSEPLPVIQKVSVGRLSPQQESSASSKRMLSPANSLDIAMEKHQKRAKDDNGAACASSARAPGSLSARAGEGHKPRKPVLVRQLCTTEPLEGAILEQDGLCQPENGSESSSLTQILPADDLCSGPSKLAVTEPISTKLTMSLAHSVRNSPVPLENAPLSPQTSIERDQGRESPGIRSQSDPVNTQGPALAPAPPTCSLSSRSDAQQPAAFPSLKTATSFTWCYLLRQRALPLPQKDQKTSAYAEWTVSSDDPNPLGLPTKVALSLLNSKQKTGKALYCQAAATRSKSDLLVYSSKWKNSLSKRALGNQKSTVVEFNSKDGSEINSEQDKENSLIKSEPRRIKIFDGGYKSNEEYVYVRGRGRGKYICEECGIRCKKPSMLKKHIRTHTDVRPYHCTHCNFSFKTKGNLTKHMKSKAHSKKCVDLGISVGLIDEQDIEESGVSELLTQTGEVPQQIERNTGVTTSLDPWIPHKSWIQGPKCQKSCTPTGNGGRDLVLRQKCKEWHLEVGLHLHACTADEKQRLSYERTGYDLEESDGPDEDDNDNDEDDEDSQAESGLSAAPSVTASPQHLPSSSGLQDPASAEEDLRAPDCFSGVHVDPMDILPRALLTKMTVLTTVHTEPDRTDSPARSGQQAANHEDRTGPSATSRSPSHHMSVDCSESEVLKNSMVEKAVASTQDASSARLPPAVAQLSPQPAVGSPAAAPHPDGPEQPQPPQQPAPAGLPSLQTRLFGHLPLHSQQQSRTPYNMVPVGGIHVVPAGLTYSTFVPIQAGSMQLTIPAVSVLHRTVGTPGDTVTQVSGTTNQAGVAELGGVVPCIPIGQIHVPGLQHLSPPGLPPLAPLGVETLNIVGLGAPVRPPGLALNAVGLQVLAAGAPAQAAPAHIPGLQILNIALPALIPAVSQVPAGAPAAPEAAAPHSNASPAQTPAAGTDQASGAEPPHGSPEVPQEAARTAPGPPAPAEDPTGPAGPRKMAAAPPGPRPEARKAPTSGAPPLPSSRPAPRPPPRTPRPAARKPPPARFSDASSDDEDRLVIAT